MIKSILGGKSKNLFDISKVVTSNVVKRNGNSLICSSYGTSIGTLGSICPTLKLSDTITISFKCTSEGVASNFMSISNTSGGLKIFSSGETFPVSEVGLSSTWYLYSTDWAHRDTPNKTTYSDIQLELGSTATEYVPHELTSYKSIMKVSDVCQLIDISKYQVKSGTTNGISWQVNQDGSITVNGTCTKGFALNPNNTHFVCNQTHIYFAFPYTSINYSIHLDGNSRTGEIVKISTSAFPTIFNTVIWSWMAMDETFNNYVIRHGVCDLTEMFGAGNEPKTVAEFKAKFPNDYYPYSPSCFVTSFDERMPCKTKNLFNYKNSDSTAKTITSNGVTLSLKNDYFELYGTQQEDKYFECSLTQFNIPFTAGKTYILSLDNAIPQLSVVYFNGFYNDDTKKQLNLLRVQGTNNNPLQTFTPTKDGYFSQIVVYSPKALRFSGNYNMRVQIEENSRKTEYVPHNYV